MQGGQKFASQDTLGVVHEQEYVMLMSILTDAHGCLLVIWWL